MMIDTSKTPSPEAAKAEIVALRADKAFIAKYLDGDFAARARMAALHQAAAPGEMNGLEIHGAPPPTPTKG